MTLDERIPGMSEADLLSLQANAQRLSTSADASQQAKAADILPAITAELAKREAAKPPKPAPKRKVAVKKVAKAAVTEEAEAA